MFQRREVERNGREQRMVAERLPGFVSRPTRSDPRGAERGGAKGSGAQWNIVADRQLYFVSRLMLANYLNSNV